MMTMSQVSSSLSAGRVLRPYYDLVERTLSGSVIYRCRLQVENPEEHFLLVHVPERSDRIDPVLLSGWLQVRAHRSDLAELMRQFSN